MSESKPCLIPDCKGHYTRGQKDGSAWGLCGSCYQSAKRNIEKGKTTWRELEDLGLSTTPVRKVPEKPTLFEQALSRKRLGDRGIQTQLPSN